MTPMRILWVAARTQVRIARRNIENIFPLLTIPLQALVSLAILVHSGRSDLASFALVASLLMTVGQMSFFDGSEILAQDRNQQILELAVASPTPYSRPLIARILVLTAMGAAGFVESWLIARIVFGIHVVIYHPILFLVTGSLTVFAGAATALITTAVFCLTRTTRTYQNAISGPLYLLSGVLVPIQFLPVVLRPLSRVIYLFWSADLLRDSMRHGNPEFVMPRLFAILVLGLIGGAFGAWLLRRMLNNLRRDGTLGLS
jgi:ABC-2 type transport system permease protein